MSKMIWLGLAALLAAFHIGLVFYGLAPALVARPMHMALILPFLFLRSNDNRFTQISGAILMLAGLWATLYIAINAEDLSNQYGLIASPIQMVAGIIVLIAIIEGARRAIGWPLPLVACAALAYAFWGHLLTGQFAHPPLPWQSLLGTLTIAEGGVWGTLTGVSVGVVAIFVILGAVLNAGEAGVGFMNLATFAAGGLRGGAGKVSVLSSGLFGSISGSASANVASTGAITMPTMMRLGYPKSLAAAIEATASTGGQIMPPLMGAGAFVMVELTGIPYTSIVIAALLPAILFFAATWFGIDGFARRLDLKPVAQKDRPSLQKVLRSALFFITPFALLLWLMFGVGRTPQYAAAITVFVAIGLLALDLQLRVSLKQFLKRFATALVTAAEQVALIGSVILCAGIVIGVLGQTGLGVKITSVMLGFAGDALWPVLLLTALACLVLGMEVPTTAAYVICVSVAGPALVQAGLEPLTAHLFVFWFALLSTITPPVCGTVFIAAGMVGENWIKVAGRAMMLGIGLYLIPLSMARAPELLDLATTPIAALIAFAKLLLALGLLSYALTMRRFGLWRLVGGGIAIALFFAL